jgi:hypothetical protein
MDLHESASLNNPMGCNGISKPTPKSSETAIAVTTHEAKLVGALRAPANRVAMWVSRGDPMRDHKDLLEMYIRFFEIANQHKIEYWLEYGSVLGYIRHGGMIPWEWDMDIGCTPENFQKLKEIGAEIDKTDPNFGFRYYRDPDYESSAFSFYSKKNENCLCDIAEYKIEGDKLVCAVEDWHYPPHKLSKILPVKKVTMLGQIALLPADSHAFLKDSETILGQCTGDTDAAKHGKNDVPFMQYDPVPFLLCHMFHPDFIEKACSPPVVDIACASSISEGFAKFGSQGKPFIVRNVDAFDVQLEAFKEKAGKEGFKTYAYDKQLNYVDDVSVADALNQWDQGTLQWNFIDSKVPKMSSNSGIIQDLLDLGITEDRLMLVLSRDGQYTPFHQDPITGHSDAGGGWMWLERGEKLWQFVLFEDSDALYDPDHKNVSDIPIADLVYQDNHAMWGKVYQVRATDKDFLYFPPGCNHRVWTYRNSFGVGGYSRLPSDDERIVKACEWYKSKNIPVEDGMFKLSPVRRTPLSAVTSKDI